VSAWCEIRETWRKFGGRADCRNAVTASDEGLRYEQMSVPAKSERANARQRESQGRNVRAGAREGGESAERVQRECGTVTM